MIGTDYDSWLRVFTDCSLATEIVENDDTCGLQSEVTFESDGSSTYIIMVEGFGANTGNFSLEVTCEPIDPNEPENNDCADAFDINCGDVVNGSTTFATDEGGNDSPDVFYSFIGDGDPEVVRVSTCNGTNYDSWLRLYSDCSLNTELNSNDDSCGLQSEIIFVSDGTTEYIIMVEGFANNAGDFGLEIICMPFDPPPNDSCDGAIAVTCDEIITGTTSSSLSDAGNNSPDVFYSYTGTGGEEWVTVSLCGDGTDYDSRLLVYEDCSLGELYSENTDFCGQQSMLTFMSDGTTTYIIIVEGASNSSGNFEMEITCDPILGLEDNQLASFEFYPNPVRDQVHISAGTTIDQILIYTILGQEVLKTLPNASSFSMDLSRLEAGTYLIKASAAQSTESYILLKE